MKRLEPDNLANLGHASVPPRCGGSDLYRELDEHVNGLLGIDLGFTALIRPTPYPMGSDVVAGFAERYEIIRDFQTRTLEIFKASLRGECDPAIAASVLGDVPPHLGAAFHRELTERQHRTPVFFRTDEPVPGKLSEIQCPGSGWCMTDEIQSLYARNEQRFGPARHFPVRLAGLWAKALRGYLEVPPVVHHLVDNASRPHGMRYFIQRTRRHGVKYFSYDRDVAPLDCNFVRSHDFLTLPHHNFFAERMARCERGEVSFDLSPSALFDGKVILAWPFWERTREFYDDRIRSVLPYGTLIDPDGFELEDGRRVTPEQFCEMPRTRRDYFMKYAGTDIALNWGSKAVFLASTCTAPNCRKLMATVLDDSGKGRRWILQKACKHTEEAPVLGRDGQTSVQTVNSKFSGFYGPDGLMGILAMQKTSHKVHGSGDTVMSAVW